MIRVASRTLNGLAICAGVGGLELGAAIAIPSYRLVCVVEREGFAASVLTRRMEEGLLDDAPIWDDIGSFDGRPWRGVVDIITAGFPCQPWSIAGRRAGVEDERWIWPDIARVVGEVGPDYVFLENVPGLVSGGGLGPVLGSLASLGFDAEWTSLRAADVGAPHKRERVFILGRRRDVAHPLGGGGRPEAGDDGGAGREPAGGRPPYLPYFPDGAAVQYSADPRPTGEVMGYANESGHEGCRVRPELTGADELAPLPPSPPFWPPGPAERDKWQRILERWPELAPATGPTEPKVRQLADGVSESCVGGTARNDELRAYGNSCSPLQAAVALRLLHRALGE